MDFQTAVVAVDMIATGDGGLPKRTARLAQVARDAGVRVVYVVVGFRSGYPEVSAKNQKFAPIRDSGRFTDGSPGTEVHAAVAPKPGEAVVVKHRVSAFAGTDLDMILRANGVDTLVLAGLATSGVVLSTLRHAADADYRIAAVVEAELLRATQDAEVHRVLIEGIFVEASLGGEG